MRPGIGNLNTGNRTVIFINDHSSGEMRSDSFLAEQIRTGTLDISNRDDYSQQTGQQTWKGRE